MNAKLKGVIGISNPRGGVWYAETLEDLKRAQREVPGVWFDQVIDLAEAEVVPKVWLGLTSDEYHNIINDADLNRGDIIHLVECALNAKLQEMQA